MHKGDTARDRILDAALETFAEKGFTAATTREIARRARVNEVTIFRQFKSKKALFGATMLERAALGQVRRVFTAERDAPVDELIARNIRAALNIFRENKQFFTIMLADGWRNPRTKALMGELVVQKGLEVVTSFMQGMMDEGKIRRGDPRIAARMVMGAVQAYFLMTDLLEGARPSPAEEERMIKGFVDIFLNGMRARPGGE